MRTVLVAALMLICGAPLCAQSNVHVFPQFADGRFSDGAYYRSTLMILPWFNSAAPNCTLTMYGMSASLEGVLGTSSAFAISIPAGGYALFRTKGVQDFQSGYARLTCDSHVFATVLYGFYSASGYKYGETTVFSSPETYQSTMIFDQREGSRLGLAIANNTDMSRSFIVTASGSFGTRAGTITIPARRAGSRFLDEIVQGLPPGSTGIVRIEGDFFSPFSAIGFRLTGVAFTTIPAN